MVDTSGKQPKELPGRDLQKQAALLRYLYGIDPEKLGDPEYYRLWEEALYIRHIEREMMVSALRQVVAEAFGKKKGNGTHG